MAESPAERSGNVDASQSGSGHGAHDSDNQARSTNEPARSAPDSAETSSAENTSGELEELEEGPAESTGDDKEECSFCVFMKAGPCGKIFAAWEACVSRESDAGHDFAAACSAPTINLQACMERHPEYYGIMAEVEKEREKQMQEQENAPGLEENLDSKSGQVEDGDGSKAPS
eukprot:jgi/Mesvir1/6469/Mv19544-RA.1